MIDKEELGCPLCGEEYTIDHFSELEPTFCPFCGESISEEEVDDYDWMDEDE